MKRYEIIYKDIVEQIHNQQLPLESKIESEAALCIKYGVSRVTIRHALEELEKDGYIRKQQGKGSIVIRRNAKPQTVLLILPNIFKYIFIDLIKAIETTLRECNISLLIANSFSDQTIERSIIRHHIDMVDAIIFEPAQAQSTKHTNSKTYRKLLSKPTVCINAKLPNFDLPFLILEDEKNMELITSYVLKKNVKRVLILSKTDDLQGFSRLQGIKKVFANTSVNTKIVEFTTENEQRKFEDFSFLYFHFKPDCIMFYNDEYAYKFMTNYNVNPIMDNIIITGFDNTEYSNGQPYKFISPNHPKGQMGVDAAEMIIKLLNGDEVQSIVYPPDIIYHK